ncbi:metallophosphoesterase family protein [Flavobacterium sp.]|uniref:metallophosphoesterase family protein n=1 Tax=Flavobacterium sp. TaxID=239 RepID=UPI003B9A0E37
MKILVLSDTHGHIDERILEYASKADEVWHAGDIGNLSVVDQLEKVAKLRAVFGNIDGQSARLRFPENNFFEVDGLSVLIRHICGYPGTYNQITRSLIETNKPKMVICGHSHILKVMRDPRYQHLHMNPGACGISGFHQIRTMLRFEIEAAKPTNLEVIELGARHIKKSPV